MNLGLLITFTVQPVLFVGVFDSFVPFVRISLTALILMFGLPGVERQMIVSRLMVLIFETELKYRVFVVDVRLDTLRHYLHSDRL